MIFVFIYIFGWFFDKKHTKNRNRPRAAEEEEIRRHSMFPKEKGLSKEKGHYDSRERKTTESPNKIQYRVRNEIFVLYDYYQPVKILGSGADAVVCEAVDTRNGNKVAVKKNKGVFHDITDSRRILREIKLLIHFDHQDVKFVCLFAQLRVFFVVGRNTRAQFFLWLFF